VEAHPQIRANTSFYGPKLQNFQWYTTT